MNGRDWPFRGREAEVEELSRYLNGPAFDSIRVGGRRRVGKTALIEEIFRRRKTGPRPVIVQLPDPKGAGAAEALRDLADAAKAAGYPAESETAGSGRDTLLYRKTLMSLIENGAPVVIDEFQYAQPLGLVPAIKWAIDCFAVKLGDPEPRGKVIVLGSHQQRILEMLRDDQPLFNRFPSKVTLHQWSLKTVLLMAAEQGFLRFPERFLSMHTAMGGMPGAWQDFAMKDEAGRGIERWKSGGEWLPAFIEGRERALRDEPADRWDNAAFVNLSDENLSVFRLIADKKGGYAERDIRGRLKMSEAQVRKSLDTLDTYLQLVEKSGPLMGGWPRWRVCDNPALFQTRVLGLGAGGPGKSDPETSGAALRASRLAVLEGQALERIAASWLKEAEGVVWSKAGAWMPGLADIDAAAERRFSGAGALILAGCKRSPDKHDPSGLRRQFEDFMAGLGDGDEAERLRSLPRRLLLISPRFTSGARERFRDSGFECVDIRSMARSFGIDPGPEPGARRVRRTRDPSDGEILRARKAVARAAEAAADHGRRAARLRAEEKRSAAELAEAESELADAAWFRFRRRSGIRKRIGKAAAAAGEARRRRAGLKPPESASGADAALAARKTEGEERRGEAAEKVREMERNGTFLPRRRDPAAAGPGGHAPESSLIFIVAKAGHCPPADSQARLWHGFAVLPPGPDVSALLALRDAFPERALTPAAEAAALWPAAAPETDFARAAEDCRYWGVAGHIDRIEGRSQEDGPEAEPEEEPAPREPDGGGSAPDI